MTFPPPFDFGSRSCLLDDEHVLAGVALLVDDVTAGAGDGELGDVIEIRGCATDLTMASAPIYPGIFERSIHLARPFGVIRAIQNDRIGCAFVIRLEPGSA